MNLQLPQNLTPGKLAAAMEFAAATKFAASSWFAAAMKI
jgi:hypothetical protein